MTKLKLKMFLREIHKLCKKYDVKFNTCGCCGGLNLKQGDKYVAEYVESSASGSRAILYPSGESISYGDPD